MPLNHGCILSCLATSALAFAAPPRKVTDAEVASVQRSAILIDTHNDVTSNTVDGLDGSGRRSYTAGMRPCRGIAWLVEKMNLRRTATCVPTGVIRLLA